MFKEKIKLCNINDLKINSVNLFKHKDTKILLTYTKDGIYLTEAICLHMGAPLEKAQLFENYLQCPWHGCKWDFKSGQCLNNSMKLKKYNHEEIDGEIYYLE